MAANHTSPWTCLLVGLVPVLVCILVHALLKQWNQALMEWKNQKICHSSSVVITLQCVGVAQGCLDKTIPYVMERKQFGRSIWDFQVCIWHRSMIHSWVFIADWNLKQCSVCLPWKSLSEQVFCVPNTQAFCFYSAGDETSDCAHCNADWGRAAPCVQRSEVTGRVHCHAEREKG